jgi:hypothetical protein
MKATGFDHLRRTLSTLSSHMLEEEENLAFWHPIPTLHVPRALQLFSFVYYYFKDYGNLGKECL